VQEHRISPAVYKVCHKPHHRFLNPVLFEAFNGSIADTVFMILIPLVCTAQVLSTKLSLLICADPVHALRGAVIPFVNTIHHDQSNHAKITFMTCMGPSTIVLTASVSQLVHCNVWSYMAFGTIYSSWLTLIHRYLPSLRFPLVRLGCRFRSALECTPHFGRRRRQ
jgi:hypothetical protein